jgi:hypothetical protein
MTKEERRAKQQALRDAAQDRVVPFVTLPDEEREERIAELAAYKLERAEKRAELKAQRAELAAEHYEPGIPADSAEGRKRHPPSK